MRDKYHIIIDHGENGITDHSMADVTDIAKMEYAMEKPDKIKKAGKTRAYSYMRDGRNRTADTVLYEKYIGNQSFYVVSTAVDTKAKTLFVVSAFIGPHGYKEGAPQLTDTNSPSVTSENGFAATPNIIIPHKPEKSTENSEIFASDVILELWEAAGGLCGCAWRRRLAVTLSFK